MTDDELREIEERAEKATPGPWEAFFECHGYDGEQYCDGIKSPKYRGRGDIVRTDSGHYPPTPADARFIAAARTDVPALCAEVRRLREIVEYVGENSDVLEIREELRLLARRNA